MKKYCFALLFLLQLSGLMSCTKYLDVNTDPDTPQSPDPSSIFPAMLAAIPRGTQYDARYISKYIQNWGQSAASATTNVWDLHGFQGYPTATDVSGDIWRQAYYGLGLNLNYIIETAGKNSQWDLVGAAYALKAMMFQMTTDQYGECIYSEAFRQDISFFHYDTQETVYRGVDSLCRQALYYLGRNDLITTNANLGKGDFVYSGNRTQWTRFTCGILARNFHRITNKANYSADSVIKYCDLAMSSNTDDFLLPFDATKNDDSNFFGYFRNNLTLFRQTKFVVAMLDGTDFAGSTTAPNRDPRMRQMLTISADTTNGNGGYRGIDAGSGETGSGRLAVSFPFADSSTTYTSISTVDPTRGKYLFRDKVVSPVMTYAEMQFIKAEAAFRKGDKTTALAAYRNGIGGHFDFINRTSMPRGNTTIFNGAPISATERAAYLAGANVKNTAAALTMTDIMLQKYIALWGWGFFETWVDMRRFHYTDLDGATGRPVYRGFITPTFPTSNNGKFAQRVRPRYNSEYVWNFDELQRIGATAPDYHTKEMWFSQP